MSSNSLRIGSKVPNFDAVSTHGKINFHQFIDNKWTLLFSHPQDFTPVCTTELAEIAKLTPEFEKRNVQLIGLSCDELESHHKWLKEVGDYGQTQVKYPVIADLDRKVATLFDMLDQQDATNVDLKGMPLTVRSVFFIDTKKVIRAIITYPAAVGRNAQELLRVIDCFLQSEKFACATYHLFT
eukprot:NODE_226_length_13883_cov_0.528729.p9 type:complete len:183 gc:universal NODE_226_length_13883_cov_0.528729:10733-10185(-)